MYHSAGVVRSHEYTIYVTGYLLKKLLTTSEQRTLLYTSKANYQMVDTVLVCKQHCIAMLPNCNLGRKVAIFFVVKGELVAFKSGSVIIFC